MNKEKEWAEEAKETAEHYMRRALALAKRGEGHTSPNPMVGCVVVKDGRVIGEGYHERYGEYHAERNALNSLTEDAAGADLYVTLEPCCHYGKTPPCTEIILERGIARVFVGCMDPNPKVAGKGIRILREHGVEVYTGILEDECYRLNEVFFHYIGSRQPFVAVKYAMTLDGKIAARTGDSRWVSGEESRRHTHMLRKKYTGIMAGIGTVLADDPMLNCRIEEGVDPVRIICDSKLRIPMDAQIVKTARQIPTIVAYVREEHLKEEKMTGMERPEGEGRTDGQEQDAAAAIQKKLAALTEAGITCLPVLPERGAYSVSRDSGAGSRDNTGGNVPDGSAGKELRLDLRDLLTKLGERGVDGILAEGGGTLNAALFEQNLVNRVYAYIAPKIIGGRDARTPVEGSGLEKMSDAKRLEAVEILRLGEDLCITGTVRGNGNL